jgi:hypothetical protein
MFKECRAKLDSILVDWKETPGRDEGRSYEIWKEIVMTERMNKNGKNVENVNNIDAENIVDIVDGRQPEEDNRKTTVTRKKDDNPLFLFEKTEEKTTILPNCIPAQQVDLKEQITMKEPTAACTYINRKLQLKGAAKVSGQQNINLLSKPHQKVNLSVGIVDQTIPGCTGKFNQWERSVGPSGQ